LESGKVALHNRCVCIKKNYTKDLQNDVLSVWFLVCVCVCVCESFFWWVSACLCVCVWQAFWCILFGRLLGYILCKSCMSQRCRSL